MVNGGERGVCALYCLGNRDYAFCITQAGAEPSARLPTELMALNFPVFFRGWLGIAVEAKRARPEDTECNPSS